MNAQVDILANVDTQPIAVLAAAVKVLQTTDGRRNAVIENEAKARAEVEDLKSAMRSALTDDKFDEVTAINAKLKKAHNTVDRAINRLNELDDAYGQALSDADKALSQLKGGANATVAAS